MNFPSDLTPDHSTWGPFEASDEDLLIEETDIEEGGVVKLPMRGGTIYVRITEYREREVRAETDALLGTRTLSMVPRMIPRTFRGPEDDLSWETPTTDHGWSFRAEVGQSSTNLRWLEIPGVENDTAEFGWIGVQRIPDEERIRAFEIVRERLERERGMSERQLLIAALKRGY